MIKKNGFNIMLFVFIIISVGIFSCQKKSGISLSGVLLQTDSTFSAMSEMEGMFEAFLFYIADDGVILRNNSYPAKGKNALKEYFTGKYDTAFILTWQPLFEKISESGDIGYTYGVHSNKDKSTGKITRGTYVTVWQRQADGTWRFVLDTGTQGLPYSPE